MAKKVAFITGATSGIGRETARALVAAGFRLYVLCRNPEKGEALKNWLGGDVHLLVGDMASLADVRAAAAAFSEAETRLDLLVNNAGQINSERNLTEDGFEETFAVNHLAPFLLTHLLLPRLLSTPDARIVNVASMAHSFATSGIDLKDYNWRHKPFRPFVVYGHSKLANILFTRELARRLEGTGVTANCLHPGVVGTEFGLNTGWFGRMLSAMVKPFVLNAEQGARTSIYLATSPEVAGVSGQYFSDCKPATPMLWALDDDKAKALWTLSEQLTGVAGSSEVAA